MLCEYTRGKCRVFFINRIFCVDVSYDVSYCGTTGYFYFLISNCCLYFDVNRNKTIQTRDAGVK